MILKNLFIFDFFKIKSFLIHFFSQVRLPLEEAGAESGDNAIKDGNGL